MRLIPFFPLALPAALLAAASSHALPSRHPFMGPAGSNNMHGDAGASDTHLNAGPDPRLPAKIEVELKAFEPPLPAQCPSFAFDSKGRLLTVCTSFLRTELLLMNPDTLELYDRFRLPHREDLLPALARNRMDAIMENTSGGSYFYIDHKDRAVIATADRRLFWVEPTATDRLKLYKSIDLRPFVPAENCPSLKNPVFNSPECDVITNALPDYDGRIWYVTRFGRVGTVNPETGQISPQLRLGSPDRPEQLQNSFSVGPDGVYIVSDRALYRFKTHRHDGTPKAVWREEYDRGSARKPGQINQGSGTTPSLMEGGYVAITDNADSRINVVVYRRRTLFGLRRKVCEVPVFPAGRSATDNSLITFGRSIIVENNYGYESPLKANADTEGGLARVDVLPGGTGCRKVWENADVHSLTAVPKLAAPTGLIYTYTRSNAHERPVRQKWAVTLVDFNTGGIAGRIPTGRGQYYNNNWSSIAVRPVQEKKAGSFDLFVGTFSGFLKITQKSGAEKFPAAGGESVE